MTEEAERKTIDDLIENFNKNPQNSRKKPPRKGNNKAKAALKPAKKDIPALVQEGTLAFEAANALKRGISMYEIAEKYGITEDRLKTVLTSAIEQIQQDAAPVLLNYVYMTLSRYELVLKSLFRNLEYPDGTVNLDIEERIRAVLKEEKEVLLFAMPKEGGAMGGGSFSVTISTASPLYKEGNIAIVEHRKATDEGVEEEKTTGVPLNGFGIPRA